MVRDDDLHIRTPSYFRCPISLDVMKSPVSLCTGVTYDRSSIQLWLDSGNNTCPATMQVLQSKDLIPNHTLHRLIKIWSASVPTRPVSSPSPTPDSLTNHQANELVNQLETQLQKPFVHSSQINRNLSQLISLAAGKEENEKILAAASSRILPSLLSVLGKIIDIHVFEKVVFVCNILLKNRVRIDSEESRSIGNCDYQFKECVMTCLKQGRLELRVAVVKFLELMAAHLFLEVNSSLIAEDDEIYSELLRLMVSSDWDPEALEVSLCFLMRLISPKKNRVKMVKSGGIKVLAMALWEAELSTALTEKILKLIEMASGCKEGRSEISGDKKCLQAIVKKLLKVSNVATEHAVTLLWSLCCLFRDKKAWAEVAEGNGMAKILVVLQSNCTPAVRQMCGDLLRVLGCNAKTSHLSCYDTKTSHIMPF